MNLDTFYTTDNDNRIFQIRTNSAENSWKNLMDEKVQRELQEEKAFIGRGIPELGVLEPYMEHDEYCYQTNSLITPTHEKKSKKIEKFKIV